ncbi:MAG: hypothetical protein MAG451_01818 [Anaerolineales bacterium]|nr:hypothetical protein [Anaerolineales bacterium]
MSDNAFDRIQAGRERQKLEDNAVHDWYQFVLAYPDHLIVDMLDRIQADQDDLILDPFCGTGTTLVECKKLSIDSVGIDANPASVLASQAKTDWSLDADLISQLCDEILAEVEPISDALIVSDTPLFSGNHDHSSLEKTLLEQSPEGQYLVESGMVQRGWIDEIPLYISIALLSQIKEPDVEEKYKRLLKVALASCIVETVANVRFGPEIYVVDGSGSYDVVSAFRNKVGTITDDLKAIREIRRPGATSVFEGDSRECDCILQDDGIDRIDHVITSPPYPTEKDYTRNTRLELVYLGFVYDRISLQRIKKQMVRSHSKGIYKSDSDGKWVADIPYIKVIADELREKIQTKTYGFAKLYPRIIEEYFGGMYRHLMALSRVMRSGGKAAYVVGEQRTYLQTFTPTGTILAKLAERPEVGLRVNDVLVWRVRQGTTGSGDPIKEEIVILEKT